MKLLVACEESQVVTKEFRKCGVEAFSNDIIDTSGEHPEWHIKCDVREIINDFNAIIAFPPCTHLASSGARHFYKKEVLQKEAISFFMMFLKSKAKYVCIENPVGIMSRYKTPSQYIDPSEFGHLYRKKTCIWLKGFPFLLRTTNFKKDNLASYAHTVVRDPRLRSRTFSGVAYAMANQWSHLLIEKD
jgi:hypothetical protein